MFFLDFSLIILIFFSNFAFLMNHFVWFRFSYACGFQTVGHRRFIETKFSQQITSIKRFSNSFEAKRSVLEGKFSRNRSIGKSRSRSADRFQRSASDQTDATFARFVRSWSSSGEYCKYHVSTVAQCVQKPPPPKISFGLVFGRVFGLTRTWEGGEGKGQSPKFAHLGSQRRTTNEPPRVFR